MIAGQVHRQGAHARHGVAPCVVRPWEMLARTQVRDNPSPGLAVLCSTHFTADVGHPRIDRKSELPVVTEAMTRRRVQSPKDSEISGREWLTQIGAKDIKYTGGRGTPPDFVINYRGSTIAVEVTLLHGEPGWTKTHEKAFDRELQRVIEEVSEEVDDPPRWHASCEYDPRQPQGSMKDGAWKDMARTALRRPGSGGKFQLLPPNRVRGRGVSLVLCPASNEGGLTPVCPDMGRLVVPLLVERIAAVVREKTEKVQKVPGSYDRWWLVFDDEILIAPCSILSSDERCEIETAVRECYGRDQWSKIVLVSRRQMTSPPPKRDKWFHALWQDGRSSPLPASPY